MHGSSRFFFDLTRPHDIFEHQHELFTSNNPQEQVVTPDKLVSFHIVLVCHMYVYVYVC